MAAALTLLLIGCLLQSVHCGEFKVTMPQTIEVLNGSCVTIPCSFDIEDKHMSNLGGTCKAMWRNEQGTVVFDSSNPQWSTIKGHLTGDLTKRDCTTTLNNMQPEHNNKYYLRVECSKGLKYGFNKQKLDITVKADPPRPTLTPSTLEVKEGTSVSLKCSAPAPCLSHPPTLTWTPSLGHSQETLEENQDKTKVKTSVVTFTASQLHHRQEISCTAVYNQQDGSTESSVSTSLTADISYSPKHTTVSVSPSGPVPEDSTVNLTCSSTANPAVRNYTWYRADGGQETFIGTRRVLNIKASEVSGPFFCKAENDLGAGRSNISQIDVQFAPQILFSSDCTKTADQLNCSCETVGKPTPVLEWYLDGLPINNSDKFAISNQPLNDTARRSFIAVNQPQERDLSSLLCRSSNSLGSASQRFCVYSLEPRTSTENHGQVTLPIFIVTVGALTAALISAILFAIRSQRTERHNPTKSQCTGDTSTAVMSQDLTSENENKVSITLEEDIYINTNMIRGADKPNSHRQISSRSSEKQNEESSDVIYSSVIWKSKSKKKGEGAVNKNLSGTSYLEEERSMEGGMSRNYVSNTLEMESLYGNTVTGKDAKKAENSEYAQVQFRDKNIVHK